MCSVFVRTWWLSAILAAGVVARADVRYTFESAFGAFTLVTQRPLTKNITIRTDRLKNTRGFLKGKLTAADFEWDEFGREILTLYQGKDHYSFTFKAGSFGTYGSRKTYVGIIGTLVVAKVPKLAAKRA